MTPPDPRNYNNGSTKLHFFTEPHPQGTAVYLSTLTGHRCLAVGRGVDLVAQVIREDCGFTTAELVALLGPATAPTSPPSLPRPAATAGAGCGGREC